MSLLKTLALGFALFFLLPLGISALLHRFGDAPSDWWGADRSSAGLLPPPASHPEAMVRVLAAPTVSWRGAVAVHSWIVVKPEGAPAYTRYDYTAWGDPIRVNGFVPDGRWFGRVPDLVFAADGAQAAALIPPIRAAVENYAFRHRGDYRAWPGPNSNTFVAAVLDGLPGVAVNLPPNAIGKDFPHDGRWLRLDAVGHRAAAVARRLCRRHARLGRGGGAEHRRRRRRARPAAPGAEAAGAGEDRHARRDFMMHGGALRA
jgi:hypothetical protein